MGTINKKENNMSEGVKETKEAIVGMVVLGAVIASEMKNGFDFPGDLVSMFAAIQGDAAKKQKLEDAIASINKVPEEIKDLSASESIEIAAALIAELPALIGALKKS